MKLKKLFFTVCLISLSAVFCINACAIGTVYSWYCKRTTDHTQPPLGADIAFVSEYGGYYIDKNHSDGDSEKVIYLTFDAGYENGNVARILDVLKKQEVTGAFFVLGHLIEDNTALVMRMFDEGHLVCNHTYSHKCMAGISEDEFREEIQKLENVCIEKTGNKLSCFFRPPEGKFDKECLSFAQNMGYKTIFWSFAYADWDNNRQMSRESAKRKIIDNIHNGAVILLHPTSKTNADILEEVIVELKNQGYKFGSLESLCK